MVVIFAVTHRIADGFVYGQSFWMTVYSMVISTVTNIMLIVDIFHTKDFNRSGSMSLDTYLIVHFNKQHSLIVIIIMLLCYILPLVHSYKLTCSKSLSLTHFISPSSPWKPLVSMKLSDAQNIFYHLLIYGQHRLWRHLPNEHCCCVTASQIFVSLYVSVGILNLRLVVALSCEAFLEGVTASFRERPKNFVLDNANNIFELILLLLPN